MQPEANPIQHTTLLNNAMKNPHLVETQIYVYPDTGKEIQVLPTTVEDWTSVRQQKANGEIPLIELNFNIQGVPLLLTTQSYLTIRFKLNGFRRQLETQSLSGRLPEDYNLDTSGWPKLNSQIINQAGTTLSNFQLQNYYPFFLNYIRHLQFTREVDQNSRQSYNDNILETFSYKNQQNQLERLTIPRGRNDSLSSGSIRQPNESPYSFSAIFEQEQVQPAANAAQPAANAAQPADYRFYMNVPDWEFDIRIPISEIIPAFQVPVLPLAQTNTSSIQLRILLNSPIHMFFLPGSVRPRGVSLAGGMALGDYNFYNLDVKTREILVKKNGQVQEDLQLEPNTCMGIDLKLVEGLSIPSELAFTQGANELNPLDCWNGSVECFLNLKVLANPLLNPLIGEYIKPFINEMNEFKASFADSFYFGQLLHFRGNPHEVLSFEFRPSQLFYNATHVGIFFASPYKNVENANIGLTENRFNSLQGYVSHGYYTLPPEFILHNFQVGLGASCVPLYDRPLNYNDLIQSTIDCFKKYGATEMLGQIVQDESRFRTGDAFVLLDLTHTRGAGYFIDADNMITVRGSITHLKAEQTLLQVNLIVFYQNSLTVLLDLDGAVLVQQT